MAQVHHFLTEVPSFPGFLKIRLLAITRGLPPSGPRMLRLRLAQKATRLPTRSVRFYQRSKTKKASDTLAGLLGVVPWRRGTLVECPDAQS